ncbi:MAG: 3D domain-containing protein [Myxococcota bacterium]|nr:3D domain-containing protein [Myxococcota bacterium]
MKVSLRLILITALAGLIVGCGPESRPIAPGDELDDDADDTELSTESESTEDTETGTHTDSESDTGANADSDGDTDIDADTDSDIDADTDGDTDTDTGSDIDTDTGSDIDTDTGSDIDTDTGEIWGTAKLTYYWVAYEDDYSGQANTNLATCEDVYIATVPYDFAYSLRIEGTGRLNDGRLLNLDDCSCEGGFACFMELGPDFPWGMGSQGNPLAPFVSIAVDNDYIEFGTLLYAPLLDGLTLPDNTVHDGCLRADDVGWGVNGMHIDWFVGLQSNYQTLVTLLPEELPLHHSAGKCDYLQ